MALGRTLVTAIAVAALVALTDCRSPTEVTLELSTDTCAVYQGTSITMGPSGPTIETTPVLTVTHDCSKDGTIGTFVVVPSADKNGQFEVLVATGVDVAPDQCKPPLYMGCIVARRVMSFVPHTPLELPIELLTDCKNVPCDALSTCVHAKCVPAAVPDPSACTGGSNCSFEDAGATGDATVDATGDQGMVDTSGDTTTNDGTVGADGGLEDGGLEDAEWGCISGCMNNDPTELAAFFNEAKATGCACSHCASECGGLCGSGTTDPPSCLDCIVDNLSAGTCSSLCSGFGAPLPGVTPEGLTDDGGDAEAGALGGDAEAGSGGDAEAGSGGDAEAGGGDGSAGADGGCKSLLACVAACGDP